MGAPGYSEMNNKEKVLLFAKKLKHSRGNLTTEEHKELMALMGSDDVDGTEGQVGRDHPVEYRRFLQYWVIHTTNPEREEFFADQTEAERRYFMQPIQNPELPWFLDDRIST